MGSCFCGWYFRCQSGEQTLALIPSVHKTRESDFCAVQVLTDSQSFSFPFPYSDFAKVGRQIRMGANRFGADGITLDLQGPDCRISGSLRFGPFTPIAYDIMGPFRFVPFLQCRHSVFSMGHRVDGEIRLGDTSLVFHNALGYCEGDRGYSFPREYVWSQCFFPEGALMLSIAEIPLGGRPFTGVIGIILLRGKEYRIATYLGARAVKITPSEIVVRQGRYTLLVQPREISGQPLRAPVLGAMHRTIHEHPACPVSYRLERNHIPLLEVDAPNAALEYEYGPPSTSKD